MESNVKMKKSAFIRNTGCSHRVNGYKYASESRYSGQGYWNFLYYFNFFNEVSSNAFSWECGCIAGIDNLQIEGKEMSGLKQ